MRSRRTSREQETPAAEVRAAIATLCSHPDPRARREAALALGRLSPGAAVPALAGALRDPAKEVREAAAGSLAVIGIPALETLTGALADGDWVVRYRAAEALGSIRDGRSVAALLRALGDERDHVRYMAAKGLGRLGDGRARVRLSAALGDENEFVRRAAGDALARLG